MRQAPKHVPEPLAPEIVASARQRYAAGERVDRICKDCGMSQHTLYYWVDGGPPSGDLHLPPLPRRSSRSRRRRLSGDRVSLVRRMWRAAEAQVRDIEARLLRDAQPPDERERDARLLAVLVKTLRELSALDGKTTPPSQIDAEDDDPVPRDIDEFRRELARRIEAFVASRTDAGLPGDAEP